MGNVLWAQDRSGAGQNVKALLVPGARHKRIQMELLQKMVDNDLGVNEEWDCGWYTKHPGEPYNPRAAASMDLCKYYLKHERLVDCGSWAREYMATHPGEEKIISEKEVFDKCRHVKIALDNVKEVPGDTADCTWCMMHANTN